MLPAAPVSDIALAWTVFVALLGSALVAGPIGAWVLRRQLPTERRGRRVVPELVFSHSPRAQRSPRLPVRMHRTLLATALLALPALIVLLSVGVLERDGTAAVEGALALALPGLLVSLHARRRTSGS